VCNRSWDGGRIWKVWREMGAYKDKTDKQLQAMEKESYSEPYHFSKLLGIKDPSKHDDISFLHCPFCQSTWDRWTEEFIGNKDYGIKQTVSNNDTTALDSNSVEK